MSDSRKGKPPAFKPVLAVTMGDPAGIGPEVVLKALTRPAVLRICRPWVIGDKQVLRAAARSLGIETRFEPTETPPATVKDSGKIPLHPIPPGSPYPVWEILKTAADLALARKVHAVVTAPVRKESITDGAVRYPGHTEFFAARCNAGPVGMMLVGGTLRIMLVTTHAAVADLPALITQEKVESAIRLAHRALSLHFGLREPKIAVAALNPHAGEGGMFGHEETKVIEPAVEAMRYQGLRLDGPLPADSAFRRASAGEFDGVVAMYHDQALIPVKLLAFGESVNFTVGLPFIRTSVDHGTAEDRVGRGTADPGSLLAAIRLAARLGIRTEAPG